MSAADEEARAALHREQARRRAAYLRSRKAALAAAPAPASATRAGWQPLADAARDTPAGGR